MKDNESFSHSQRVLVDKKGVDKQGNEKRYYWHIKKLFVELLSDTMHVHPESWSQSKLERVSDCASMLGFIECATNPDTDPKKLFRANFCKHPLCPGCQKRRQMKNFSNLVKVLHYLQGQEKQYEFIMVTLTTPNVSLDNLKDEIRHYFKSWSKLVKRREVQRVIQGFVRTLEITYNSKTDTYHPHIHALIAVNKSYFNDKTYIKRDRWLELWQQSTKQPEITQVDARRVRRNRNEDDPDGIFGVSKEICKYITKDFSEKGVNGDFIKNPELINYGMKGHLWIRDTKEDSADVVEKLSKALNHQRLFEFGGVMKEAKKQLKLQDADDKDADLVNVNEEETGCKCEVCGGGMQETYYTWRKMEQRYYSKSSRPMSEVEKEKAEAAELKKKKKEYERQQMKEDWKYFKNLQSETK